MREELITLKNEFERIKKMGYVRTTRSGTTGIGKTFEDLIGKEEDVLEGPDYHGIEIKTKRGYTTGYITLFNAVPLGLNEREIERLKNVYGYPDSILKNEKVLRAVAEAKGKQLVNKNYIFKLSVDYKNEKVNLIITDQNSNIIDNSTFWDFDFLKIKLETKLQYLAYIKAWPTTRNNVDYYKYYSIKFYKLRNFETFIKLIEQGKIIIVFNIGVYRNGPKKGEILDRGTSFRIKETDLDKLFKTIYV